MLQRVNDRDGQVEALLHEVGKRELMPRFRHLAVEDVRLKARGEVVTTADLEAERVLTGGLLEILPGSIVVGEEACAAEPGRLDGLATHARAWVIDPLDGTAHFAADDEPFGTIIALLEYGETVAGWIHMPASGITAYARRGQGAFVDAARLRFDEGSHAGRPRGGLFTSFLPDDLRGSVDAARDLVDVDDSHRCAAQSYVDLITGTIEFALYYRTRPWDHAAGALMVTEAGGVARRYDGSSYVAADGRKGLLVARSNSLWNNLHDNLVPSVAVATAGGC